MNYENIEDEDLFPHEKEQMIEQHNQAEETKGKVLFWSNIDHVIESSGSDSEPDTAGLI